MSEQNLRTAALVSERELARTYSPPSYDEPWEAVEDYRSVIEYAKSNPDQGSSAIATRFNLPRGRIRPWLEDSRPDSIRGIQTAEEHGWIDVETGSDTFRGMNVLLAWVMSGGSILKQTWAPYWVVDDDSDRELVEKAASMVGVDVSFTRSATEGRAQELRPVMNGSVLGRVLVVLGAPRGEKNESSGVSLPRYLLNAPTSIRREFVQIYLRNRGQSHERSNILRFSEDRSENYLKSVAALISDLTGESVSVSGKNVILSVPASQTVQSWPKILSPRNVD